MVTGIEDVQPSNTMVTGVENVKKKRKRGTRGSKTQRKQLKQNVVSDETTKMENVKPDAEMSVTKHDSKALSSTNDEGNGKMSAKKRKSQIVSEESSPKQPKQDSEEQYDELSFDEDDGLQALDRDDDELSIDSDLGVAADAEELLWETNYNELVSSEKIRAPKMSKMKQKKLRAATRPSREKMLIAGEKLKKINKKKQRAVLKRKKYEKRMEQKYGEEKEEKEHEEKEEKEHAQVFNFDTPEGFLASLIAPISIEKFFSEYWEKKPLFIQRKDNVYAETYKQLFSRKSMEQILIKRNIEFVKDVNVCRFVGEKRESLNSEGRVTQKKIKKLLDQQKGTVQFHQPQRFQDKLWHINEQLESYFHSLVGANVYMTPQDSQGLAPHYDDVDVFILQLEGEKRWQLHKPPTKLPRDYSKDLDQSTIGKPTHDILLKPGNVLYFPRGTIHYAMTPKDSPSHSTHVTISTYQRSSWGDLLSVALPRILQTAVDSSVAFRKGLPQSYIGGDEATTDAHRSHMTTLLQKLGDHLKSHDQVAANEMMCDFVANRLPPFMKDGKAQETKGPMPTDQSKVRLAFPSHTYVTQLERKLEEQFGSEASDSDEEPQSEEEEEDDDGDEGMEVRDRSSKLQHENANEDEDDETEESEQIYVYHSVKNTRQDHMMTSEPNQCAGLKFAQECLSAMKQLMEAKDKWVSALDLQGVEQTEKMQLLTSLWAEGLLEVM